MYVQSILLSMGRCIYVEVTVKSSGISVLSFSSVLDECNYDFVVHLYFFFHFYQQVHL